MNLLHAIRLLDLGDSTPIYLAKRLHQNEAWFGSISMARKTFDLRAVEVRKINPWHSRFSPDVSWEFVIERWENITGLKDYSKPKPKTNIKRKEIKR